LTATAIGPRYHDRHCRYYVAFAERAQPELRTHGEAVWLPRLDAEVDNFRAALDWSLRDGDPTLALRLAGLLADYWEIRARGGEGLEWTEAALDAAGDGASIHDRARGRRGQARLLESQGAAYDRLDELRACASDALDLSRTAGDPAGIANALLTLASVEMDESRPQRRRRAFADEALIYAREAGDDMLVGAALVQRVGTRPPELETAELEEADAVLRRSGSTRLLAYLYCNAAYNEIGIGSPTRARSLLDRALPLALELGEPVQLTVVYGNMGLEALFTDDLDRARPAFEEMLRLCREHVVHSYAAEGLGGLAALATRRGDWDRAAHLLGAAAAAGPVGDAEVSAQLEERFFASARAQLGKRRWSEAQAAGAEMSFEEAIAFALSTDPAPG
jgi:tetratricopeptide (TPR) repeat protein